MKLNKTLEALIIMALAVILWLMSQVEIMVLDASECIPVLQFAYIIFDYGYGCAWNTTLFALIIIIVLLAYHRNDIKKIMKGKKK